MKHFDNRNTFKKSLDRNRWNFYPKNRQVRFAHLGINLWYEQNGSGPDFKRPVLVLKKIWNVYLVLPMTTKWKDDSPFYYNLSSSYFNKESRIILSQIRVIDLKRFSKKIGKISSSDFIQVKEKLKALLL